MKASELRIGNWVYWPTDEEGQEAQVDGVAMHLNTVFFKDRFMGITLDAVKPIPLTEEWLKRFGFVRAANFDNGYRLTSNSFCIEFEVSEKGEILGSFLELIGIDIQYVHQLQNLYFALTGSELELKH